MSQKQLTIEAKTTKEEKATGREPTTKEEKATEREEQPVVERRRWIHAKRHVIVDTVSRLLFDELIEMYDPEKIVVIVSSEDEDEYRREYEKIYHLFKDRITLYAGEKQSLVDAYKINHPDVGLYFYNYEMELE